MKHRTLFIFLFFALVLSACGGESASEPKPAETEANQPAAQATQSPATSAPEATAEPTPIPAPTLPPLQANSGRYIYTNANEIYDIAQYRNLIFAGGTGGLVSWDIGTGFHRKFTTMDGLRHISIYAVETCNMPEPRIVIGHELGVDLYDPQSGEFEPLSVPEETPSINTKINEITCDQANNRLILGYSGIGVYDFVNNTYTRYTSSNGLSWNGVSGISVIGRDIWVLTGYNGVNVVAPDGTVTIYDESTGMQSQRAYAAARANDGTIWVGTSTGLLKFKGNQWSLMDRSTTGAPGEVNNLFAAPDGTLWLSSYPIGTGRLCQFDPAQEKCLYTHEYSRDGVAAFELIGENPDLIFYGTRQGLYLLKPGEEKAELWSIGDDEKMRSNSVSSIALDSNNQMWVGTTGGMMVLDPADPQTAWTSYRAERDTPNVPGGNWASALTPVENGGLWAVITNGQLSYFDGAGKWTVFDGPEFYSARLVGIDPQGRAWVVKDDQPARVFENGEQVAEYTPADGLPEGRLTVLFNDGDSLWIGGNGLSRFKDGKIETIFGKDDFSGVIAIARDVDGSLLVARSNSLIRLDDNNIPTVVLKGEYGDDILDVYTGINSMALDSTGVIYLATSQGLLISEDGGASWVRITTEGGITTNYLRVVFVDQYDTLWMGGGDSFAGGGLMRYVP